MEGAGALDFQGGCQRHKAGRKLRVGSRKIWPHCARGIGAQALTRRWLVASAGESVLVFIAKLTSVCLFVFLAPLFLFILGLILGFLFGVLVSSQDRLTFFVFFFVFFFLFNLKNLI